MRKFAALLIVGCACGRGLSVQPEPDAGSFRPSPSDGGAAACDVFLQDCPTSTDACFLLPLGTAVCAAPGAQGEGAPCSLATDCLRGFTCAGGGQSVCHQRCAASGTTNTCSEGQGCGADGLCSLPGSYAACTFSGGLDHLTLRRSEPARGLCTVVSLAFPANNPHPALSVTAGWGVTNAFVTRRPGGCPDDSSPLAAVEAQQLTGRIELVIPDGGFLPTSVSAFVTVFPRADAGVPSPTHLIAAGLPVPSCF